MTEASRLSHALRQQYIHMPDRASCLEPPSVGLDSITATSEVAQVMFGPGILGDRNGDVNDYEGNDYEGNSNDVHLMICRLVHLCLGKEVPGKYAANQC